MFSVIPDASTSESMNQGIRYMKRVLIAALLGALALGAASAQTAAPDPSATPSAASAPAAPMSGKQAREQCKADAKAQGLKGEARKTAVQDCFAKARPDLAKAQQCRKYGKAKGLADARKELIDAH